MLRREMPQHIKPAGQSFDEIRSLTALRHDTACLLVPLGTVTLDTLPLSFHY